MRPRGHDMLAWHPTRRTLAWSAVVAALVLGLPALRYFTGDLRIASPEAGQAPVPSAAERQFGDTAVTWEPVMDIVVGEGVDQIAYDPSGASGVPSKVEVIAPGARGDVWVVDRPNDRTRVRLFSPTGLESTFEIPVPATQFTPGADRSLWYDEVGSQDGSEVFVHVDTQGNVLGRYPLPEGLLPRLIIVSDRGVYAFTEEWSVDLKAEKAEYAGRLSPIVEPDGTAVADPISATISGNLIGPDGLAYGMESQVPAFEESKARQFDIVAWDMTDGSEQRRIKVGPNEVLAGVTADGLVLTRQLVYDEATTPGQSTFGDPIGNFGVRLWDESGVRGTTRLAQNYTISGWAPPLLSADRSLYATSIDHGTYHVWRLNTQPAVAAATAKSGGASSGSPDLLVIVNGEPWDADPYAAQDVVQRDLFSLIYRGLVSMDASLAPVPDLAEFVPTQANGGVSDDGRTITYRLREVSWSDGTPVTSDDVVATWRYLRTQRPWLQADPFPGFERIASVEAGAEREVIVHLTEPFGAGPEAFFPHVLPAHLMTESGGGLYGGPWTGAVGSGPYRLARWDADGWHLVADTDSEEAPRIAGIDIVFASGDAARSLFADASVPTVWGWVDPRFEAEILRGRSMTTRSETGRWWGLLLNARADRLRDVATRRALAGAVPLAQLREGYLSNVAANDTVDSFPRASASHEAASIPAADAASVKTGVLGERRLILHTTNRDGKDEVAVEAVDVISRAWTAAGVPTDTGLARPRMYASWWNAGAVTRMPYDAAYAVLPSTPDPGWGGVFDPGDTPGPENPAGMGITRTNDEQLRRLYTEARASYDPARRAEIGRAITARVRDLAIGVPIAYEVRTVASSAPVDGITPAPYPAGLFWNVESWSLEASK